MVLPLIIGGFALVGILGWIFGSNLNGKTIAILGARASGKSRFFEYIATQKLSNSSHYSQTKYKQTVASKHNVEKAVFDKGGKNIEFDLVKSIDVAGGSVAYQDWKEVAKNADILLYLINAEKLLSINNSDYKETIKKDISEIEKTVREKTYDKVVIVVTHCDKIQGYTTDFDSVYKRIERNGIIDESIIKLGGTKKCELIVGSLKDTKEAEKLLKSIAQSL